MASVASAAVASREDGAVGDAFFVLAGEVSAAAGSRPRVGHDPSTYAAAVSWITLIRSAGRDGLRRRFDPGVLDELALIVAAQEADFSLAEIEPLLRAARQSDPDVRDMLSAKADAVDAKINRLVAMRDQLRHAASCGSPRLLDCDTFRSCLELVLPRRHDPNPVS